MSATQFAIAGAAIGARFATIATALATEPRIDDRLVPTKEPRTACL